MSSKMPPVPEANRSPMGPGDQGQGQAKAQGPGDTSKSNPDKVGQTANTRVNTTNQGLQQDR